MFVEHHGKPTPKKPKPKPKPKPTPKQKTQLDRIEAAVARLLRQHWKPLNLSGLIEQAQEVINLLNAADKEN